MQVRRDLERPDGLSDFVLEDMTHRNRIRELLLSEFTSWGYNIVETSVLEYVDTFVNGIHRGEEELLYRMFDPHGHTLALRPEMTTPVARIAATILADEPLPLRMCYSAKTYRDQAGRAHDRVEVTQVGVELIGDVTPDGDAEVVALMVSALRRLGLTAFGFAIGHMGLVRAMLEPLPEQLRQELRQALIDKDLVAYEQSLHRAGATLSAEWSQYLLALPRIRGGRDAVSRVAALALNEPARQACEQLNELWDALEAHGVADFVNMDLGLYLNHEYYTGIVVEGYAESLGQAICFGGRYDSLLEKFGRTAPATGCVLHLERLQTVVPKVADTRPMALLYYDAQTRSAALAFTAVLRRHGCRVSARRADANGCQLGAPQSARPGERVGVLTGGAASLAGDPWLAMQYAEFRAGGDGVSETRC